MIKNQIDHIFSLTESTSIWKEGEVIVTSKELNTPEGRLKFFTDDEYPIWLAKFENKFGKFNENNKIHINIRKKWINTKKINLDFFKCKSYVIVWKDGQKKIKTNYDVKIAMKISKFPFPFDFVGGHFDCQDNQLTSLEGAPQLVGGSFDCHMNQITTLEGAPQEVGVHFDCSRNQLTSLKWVPKKVGGSFNCHYNKLTSLEGTPTEVKGSFTCDNNQLTSLEGAPKKVRRSFECQHNQLNSLIGSPEKVGGHFNCAFNELISLEGAPKEIGEGVYCGQNQLISLEGAPKIVGGAFHCSGNINLPRLEIKKLKSTVTYLVKHD